LLLGESGGERGVVDKRGLRMRVSSGEQHESGWKLRLSRDWDGGLRERVWGGVFAAAAERSGDATAGAGFTSADSGVAAADSGVAATAVCTGVTTATERPDVDATTVHAGIATTSERPGIAATAVCTGVTTATERSGIATATVFTGGSTATVFTGGSTATVYTGVATATERPGVFAATERSDVSTSERSGVSTSFSSGAAGAAIDRRLNRIERDVGIGWIPRRRFRGRFTPKRIQIRHRESFNRRLPR
jgi:hypothetical protein